MNKIKLSQNDFLINIIFLIKKSQKHYSLYLSNNKTFLYAKSIYRSNKIIMDTIQANIHLIPEDKRVFFMELLMHYDIWMSQFEILQEKLAPDADTPFIFERPPETAPFPKDFCDSLHLLIND